MSQSAAVALSEDDIIQCMLEEHQNEQNRKSVVAAELERLRAENAAMRGDKPARAKRQAAAEPRGYRNPAPAPIVLGLPEKGTLDAADFLQRMRRLQYGNTTTSNWKAHTSITNRSEMIRCIAAFCGYDCHGDFGAQDLAARVEANRQLNSEKTIYPATAGCSGESPRQTMALADASHQVYAVGLPNAANKERDNLLAQEQKCIDTILELDKDTAYSTKAKAIKLGIEKARLQSIQEQLAKIGV